MDVGVEDEGAADVYAWERQSLAPPPVTQITRKQPLPLPTAKYSTSCRFSDSSRLTETMDSRSVQEKTLISAGLDGSEGLRFQENRRISILCIGSDFDLAKQAVRRHGRLPASLSNVAASRCIHASRFHLDVQFGTFDVREGGR